MRKLIVSEFVSLDGVIQAPGGKDEDRDGGFEYGGWTMPYWHDDIGATFGELMHETDAFLLGRRTYETHAAAFEPMPAGDPFGDMMNAPKKYVVSRTIANPIWRNTEIIRDNVVDAVRKLKAEPGKNIMTDGSSQLVHELLKADLVDEIHVVSESEIADALRFAFFNERIVLEGAAAAVLAVLLRSDVGEFPSPIVAVMTGDNIDMHVLLDLLNGARLSGIPGLQA